MISLPEALPVLYTVLEEKFAGRTVFAGRLVQLSSKEAVLQTNSAVAVLSNLKLPLLTCSGAAIPGELFAKVVEAPTGQALRVVIRFTSVPEEVRTFLRQWQPSIETPAASSLPYEGDRRRYPCRPDRPAST